MVAVTMLTDRHPTARPNVYDPRTSHKVGWIPVQKAGLNEGITSERQAVSLLWSVSYKVSVVVSAITDHTAHHRGALTVYARVSGLVPPMPYMD